MPPKRPRPEDPSSPSRRLRTRLSSRALGLLPTPDDALSVADPAAPPTSDAEEKFPAGPLNSGVVQARNQGVLSRLTPDSETEGTPVGIHKSNTAGLSASIQENDTRTRQTYKSSNGNSLPLCLECTTLFTRPEAAKFREKLAELPKHGLWHRDTAAVDEGVGERQSALEEGRITMLEWAMMEKPHYKDTPQEPKIEMHFSRSRISILRTGLDCSLCQQLLCLSNKDQYPLWEKAVRGGLNQHEMNWLEDSWEAEIEAAEVSESSASLAGSTLLFLIDASQSSTWLRFSLENFDLGGFSATPRMYFEVRAPIGDISVSCIPWIGYDSFDGLLPESLQERIKDLLKTCNECHQKCSEIRRMFSEETPSSILNLCPSGVKDQDWIKLEEYYDDCPPYATLSYCWGGDQNSSTTSTTIDKHKRGIRISTLPLTIQHAIIVARSLDIQYLWVDSLCIIQGSSASTNRELGKMAGIYNGAYITILASSAATCQEGFLGVHDHTREFRLPYLCQNGEIGTMSLSHVVNSNRLLKPSPADHRAWIFQEQFMSPRVLEFRDGGFIFTCSNSEFIIRPIPSNNETVKDSNGSLELHRLRESFTPSKPLPFVWDEVLSQYSMRELTNRMDKFSALSSVASLYQKMTGDRYLAGLWQSQLPRLLLWRRPYLENSRPDKWRAPSWSPLSVDGLIFFGLPMMVSSVENKKGPIFGIQQRRKQRNEITIPRLEFLDASVSLLSAEVPYGCITGASLEVKGKLVCYQSIFGDWDSTMDIYLQGFSDLDAQPAVETWDEKPYTADMEAACMGIDKFVARNSQHKFSTIHAFLVCEIKNSDGQFFACILLERLKGHSFRRIGTYFAKQSATQEELNTRRHLYGYPSWNDFQNAKEESITLV